MNKISRMTNTKKNKIKHSIDRDIFQNLKKNTDLHLLKSLLTFITKYVFVDALKQLYRFRDDWLDLHISKFSCFR